MLADHIRRRLEALEAQAAELEARLADPVVASDHREFSRLNREHAALLKPVETFARYKAAEAAIEEFNGKDLGGRPLRINAAEERPNRGGGGGGGGGGRSFGGPRRSGPPPPMSFGFDEGGFGGGGGGGSDRPQKNKGSRRGLRGKKRSL